ncbi:MAG: general stress protein, partial [Devosia sp.]
MRTITGLFDTYDHAATAVRSLKDAGVPSSDISIVANNADGKIAEVHPEAKTDAVTGAEVGVATGAGVGLLAGLGALAIPGVGPVVA